MAFNEPDSEREAEYEFVERLSEDQICPICKEVVNEPHLINCCEKKFCRTCLEKWLNENKACPHCRSRNHSHMLMKETSRKLNQLKVYCPNQKNGCKATLKKDELFFHLSKFNDDGCLFVKLQCPQNCLLKVFRGDLEKHVKQECPKRRVSCPHCKKRGKYEDIHGFHLHSCPLYPVTCPNKCGAEVPRKDLKSHRDTCLLEKISCQFYEMGCKAQVCRCDLEDHVKSSVVDHLAMLARSHLSMKEEYKKKCQAVSEVMKTLPRNISGVVQVAQIQTLVSDTSDAEVDKPLYLTLSESNMISGQHHIRVDKIIYKLQWEQLRTFSSSYKYRFTLQNESLFWYHTSKISIYPYNAKKREYIELKKTHAVGTVDCTCKEVSGLQIEIIFSGVRGWWSDDVNAQFFLKQ